MDSPTFNANGVVYGLGRDTDAAVAHWDAVVATTKTAPRIFAAGATPSRSPNVRRFHYSGYQDQRSRGFCVGFNFAGTIKTRLRIPEGATETAGAPLPEVALSPLYCYAVSRIEAARAGVNLGRGDGSIGAYAASGSARLGNSLEDLYPSGPSQVDGFRNGTSPTKAALDFGAAHPVKEYALAESFAHALELNAGGFPLGIESAIPSGMMQCDPKGFFRMRGGVVGGHHYQLIDHDRDKNLAWIGQSWARWGEQTADPEYSNRGGYTQIGTCPLDELERWFSGRAMANGSSAMIVVNTVEGFAPPLLDLTAWD